MITVHAPNVYTKCEANEWCSCSVSATAVRNKVRKFPGSFTYVAKDGSVKEVYIKQVLYKEPATIVFWSDDTKTVSKCHNEDKYSPESGLTLCIMKKLQEKSMHDIFEAWVPDEAFSGTDKKGVFRTLKDVRNTFAKIGEVKK